MASQPVYIKMPKMLLNMIALLGARDRNRCCREPLSIDTILSAGKIFNNFKKIRSSVSETSAK